MKRPTIALLFLIASACSVLPKPKSSALHDFGYPYSSSSPTVAELTQHPADHCGSTPSGWQITVSIIGYFMPIPPKCGFTPWTAGLRPLPSFLNTC